MNILKEPVLVLNRNWQAVNSITVVEAVKMMAADAATGLDVHGDYDLRPVKWADWIALPVRAGDRSIKTARGLVRGPTTIIAVNFAKVPKKRPKLSRGNIHARDKFTCQYCGQPYTRKSGNVDHIIPASRGGTWAWGNLVGSCVDCNSRKADRTPEEAGLARPRADVPKEVPVSMSIALPADRYPDWSVFLGKKVNN